MDNKAEYTQTRIKPGNYVTLMAGDFWINYSDNIFPHGKPLSDELKSWFKKNPVIKVTEENIHKLLGETSILRQATKEEIIKYHLQKEDYELISDLNKQTIFNEGCQLSTLEELQKPAKGTLIVTSNSDGTFSTKKVGEDDINHNQ